MKTALIIVSFLLLPVALPAQATGEGKVKIIQDPAIEQLVQKHIKVNETRDGIPGYRIQIFFDSGTNSKINAKMECEKFRRRYPGTGVYLTFISPNYKVRVGDFRTRLDAFRFLQELQSDYPNGYVVADQINSSNID
ncbi:MAG: SPOR domain-containing protein [Bacteroidales bacterium]|nr:SPOR domain-containing protein [Bacteroidales bacterium]